MRRSRVPILLLAFFPLLLHCKWLKPTDNTSSPSFFINSWWILFSGWHQFTVMVQNFSSTWLACCLLAEKSVYIRIFGKKQNVMLWGRRSYFVLFLQDLNFEIFTLSYMWFVLRKDSANCSGGFFLFILLLSFWQSINLNRMWHSVHTLRWDVWQICQRVQHLWEKSQIFLWSIFVSPLEFHTHLTATYCFMQILSHY